MKTGSLEMEIEGRERATSETHGENKRGTPARVELGMTFVTASAAFILRFIVIIVQIQTFFRCFVLFSAPLVVICMSLPLRYQSSNLNSQRKTEWKLNNSCRKITIHYHTLIFDKISPQQLNGVMRGAIEVFAKKHPLFH